jgi:ligand-binding SRPBCC domain-containing protein
MTLYSLHRVTWVPLPLPRAFEFFSRAENLERITPPWMHFRIVTPGPIEMKQGATIAYALRVRGIPLRWLTEIERWNPPFEFIDVQAKGPYRLWRHTHRFSGVAGGTSIVDIVDYALPFGLLGRIVHRLQVARDLAKIFDYRAERVQALLKTESKRTESYGPTP